MTSKYTVFDPKVKKPLHELTRDEAKAAYEWFLSQKDNRKDALHILAKELGLEIVGDDERKLIETLHQLLVSEIRKEGKRQTPSPYIYSICNDVAVFMSDLLIRNAPQLTWDMYTAGKDDLLYQRPVVRGFNVKNKKYSVDFDYLLCQYAHRLCMGGEKEEDLLWNMYQSSLCKA